MNSTLIESLLRPPLAKGKTKTIYERTDNPTRVFLIAQDDITAGDGRQHDVIPGKAMLANETTSNVFYLLKACGVPVAFECQLPPIATAAEGVFRHGFEAPWCKMLPYEVVIRREAHGSCIDRNPHLSKGHVFPRLTLEFFLKTSGKKWQGVKNGNEYTLEKDDPLIEFDYPNGLIKLFYPGYSSSERKTAHKGALVGQGPFLTLPIDEVFSCNGEEKLIERMGLIARESFLILEKAWQLLGRKLVDFKIEFGLGPDGELLLADVIDNDSWRLLDEAGHYVDKQVYRDGGTLCEVAEKYRQVTKLTKSFRLPTQQLILWRGSDKDDLEPFKNALAELPKTASFDVTEITCSAHKQPALAYRRLQEQLTKTPDAVIIAYVGMSNSAGPILSANTTVPVITVPAGYKEFPNDIWSSLRTPSNVPVSTILNPANAVLHALQILAMRNPRIYASLRWNLEERLTDI